MPQFSAPFRALAQKRGFDPIPIVQVGWPSETGRYSDRPLGLEGVAYFPRVLGVDITPSSLPLRPGGIAFPEGSVTLANRDRLFTRLAQGGADVRRSPITYSWAAIDRAAHGSDGPGGEVVAAADWHRRFSGIVDRIEELQGGDSVKVIMRANDAPLQGLIPKAQITEPVAPLAPAASRGIYWPIIYGRHDGSGVTGRGFVPTVCWASDVSSSQWRYAVMLGHAAAVPRVYKDGTLQVLTTDYLISHPVVGGNRITSIDMAADPGEGAVITCDVDGIEDVGDGTGNLIANRVEQLKHILTNYGFGDARDPTVYGWLDPAEAPIDSASLARCASHADAYSGDASIHIGGTTQPTRIDGFISDWNRSNVSYRFYWTRGAGALGLAIVADLRFGGYTSPGAAFASDVEALFVRGYVHDLDASFSYEEDTTLLVRRVDIEHLFSPQDEKFFGNLALQDLGQAEDVSEAFQMAYSLAVLL